MNGSGPSLVRAIRGPITLITVGVLFAMNNFTTYSFDKTWPVILIVFGLLSLLRRGTEPALAPPPNYPYSPAMAPYPPPPPPPVFNPPPTGPAGRGGFGTSAPPRATETAPPSPTEPPQSGGVL